MKRIDRKRLEALQKVQNMAQLLTWDLVIAAEELAEAIQSAKPSKDKSGKDTPGKEPYWDVPYAGKTVLRTLFSHVDVLAYTVRSIAVEYAQELGVQIPDEERRKLQELRGTKDGKPVQGRPSPIESFEIGLRYFPALFGVESRLDLSTEPAKAFLALAEIGKEITCPRTLEQLSGRGTNALWHTGASWYLEQVSDLFRLCAQQVPDAPLGETPALPEPVENPASGATGADEAAGASSLRDPDLLKRAFDVLKGDTARAMGVSTKMAGKDDLQATHGQFGLRNLLRTVLSEAEALIAIAAFFLSAATGRSELAMSDEEVEELHVRGDLDQKLLEITNLWSQEIGHQKQKRTGGKKWEMFRQALKYRDRVAHPRSPKDLRVSVGETSIILGAQDWVRNLCELLEIDPEKLPKSAPESEEKAIPNSTPDSPSLAGD
ncbi:MAG: hypothetical protein WAM82_06330 [Thermoanaerobaculia bacterium]